jgi:hypothetical protein
VAAREGGHGGETDPLGVDDVPVHVVASAKSVFGKRGAPRDLAILISDSIEDGRPCTGPRSLLFKHDSGSISVLIAAGPRHRTVQVRADQRGSFRVEFLNGASASPRQLPEGDWVFDAVDGDLLRLWHQERSGSSPLHTEWLRI